MESQNLAVIGQIVGPGGLVLAVMLLVFKDIIRKDIFPTLSPDAAERILSLIIRGTLVVTLLGMGLWAVVELAGSGESNGWLPGLAIIAALIIVPLLWWRATPRPASVRNSPVQAQSGGLAFAGAVHDSPITIVNQGIDQAVLLKVLDLAQAKDQASQQALDEVSKSLDLTKAQIVAAYRIIEVSDISPEQAVARLSEHFLELYRLRAAVAVQPGESPAIQALRATAKARWEAADYDGVDAALAEIEGLQSAGMADTRAQRGDAAMAARRFRDAARHFAEAAHLLPDGRAPKHREYLLRQAEALYRQGDERGENAALDEAIAVYRGVLTRIDRRAGGDAWGDVQNKLGTALASLGVREPGTARLEAAVAAFEQALLEWTRERVPLAWATTQNNIGAALQSLGAREPGTARLEAAVVAFEQALLEWTRERVPLAWATTQNNLGTALRALGEREPGTARLEAAVAAYEQALLERTRDRVPLDWAMTQNNLGSALAGLGEREAGTARLEAAVTAYEQALLERTRERVPLDWAMTQNSLGNALRALGEREAGTARLEAAVAAYEQALLEWTRDRVPLNWALTQNNLGTALWSLGERELGTAQLKRAEAAYLSALEVLSPTEGEYYFQGTTQNLAEIRAEITRRGG